ncbi:MAG: hypothetical protein QOH91_490 [Mycobacterium sp.]|jgi:hypothetical protein|nr:hypothetical protein [Mycobacterium sp.]
MTTHEDQTLTDPNGQTQPEVSRTDPSIASPEPSVPSSAPSPAVGQEQNQSQPSVAPVDPSTAADAVSEEPAPSAEAATALPESRRTERESSTAETLFADDELAELRARWAGVQAAFVDDPKDCVQKADVLVSDLVDQLTSGFAQARTRLEEQWARGQEASTEDLRLALMHYREFFERLLAV